METNEQVTNNKAEGAARSEHEGVSRRAFMGVAAMAGASLATASAFAQTRS